MLEKCQPQTRVTLSALARDVMELREMLNQCDRDVEVEQELKSLYQQLEDVMPTIRADLAMCDEDNFVDQLILEVSGGVGGQEAMLFADELAQTYENFAGSQGWDFSVVNRQESELGGLRTLSAQIGGSSCFKYMRHEGGVHRVQRVPKTEKSGRVHTSTVAVHVIPVVQTAEQHITSKDITITTSRSSGAGGQHVNKTESCVLITHLPTGIAVECQEERSQIANRIKALQKLQQMLILRDKEKIMTEYQNRKSVQVANLSRSEKIRTYNFPQDRITDHRLSDNLYDLKSFMRGDGSRLFGLMRQLNDQHEEDYVRQMIKSLTIYSVCCHCSGTSISPPFIFSMMSCGLTPSTVQPTDCAVPSTSFTVPSNFRAMDRSRMTRATAKISSRVRLPLCLMFFTFFLSRGGSFSALITRLAADGTTSIVACRFWIVRRTVHFSPFQSCDAFAMSSPTFFGDRPSGPIFGASDDVAPTSPPTTRKYTAPRHSCHDIVSNTLEQVYSPIFTSDGSNLGGIFRSACCHGQRN